MLRVFRLGRSRTFDSYFLIRRILNRRVSFRHVGVLVVRFLVLLFIYRACCSRSCILRRGRSWYLCGCYHRIFGFVTCRRFSRCSLALAFRPLHRSLAHRENCRLGSFLRNKLVHRYVGGRRRKHEIVRPFRIGRGRLLHALLKRLLV